MIKTYRKKPVEISAIQWTGENLFDVTNFCMKGELNTIDSYYNFQCKVENEGLKIKTLEGEMLASVGDYIIKGVNGEFYPCKPEIFQKTYELVAE